MTAARRPFAEAYLQKRCSVRLGCPYAYLSVDIPIRRSARLYNGMTQASSMIIVAAKPSMEYAKLCMDMRSGKARYSA